MKILFLITGRSNAGKSTITNNISELFSSSSQILNPIGNYKIGKLYTTRKPRENESAEKSIPYHFVDNEFLSKNMSSIIDIRNYIAEFGNVTYALLNDKDLFSSKSKEDTSEKSIPVTVIDTQIDSYLTILEWFEKYNAEHPDDPCAVFCLYLYTETDELIYRAYQRELTFDESKQNWKEIVRRIVSETKDTVTSSNMFNLFRIADTIIRKEMLNSSAISNATQILGGANIYPKYIDRRYDNTIKSLSLVEDTVDMKSLWPIPTKPILPPFFYINETCQTLCDVTRSVVSLINYLVSECSKLPDEPNMMYRLSQQFTAF